jgi:acyl-coenzyme A synthetase/AMP-(fatty) acid ligase
MHLTTCLLYSQLTSARPSSYRTCRETSGRSQEIAILGKHLQDRCAKRVAVYLPNSLEFLAALFAGAFYGFTPILIPYNQPHQTLIELLLQTGADALIAEAGSVPLAEVGQGVSNLRSIIWTVEKTSRHMDWSEVPEGIGGKIDVAVWHELVQEQKNTATALPSTSEKPPNVVFLWQEATGKSADIVEFTQQVGRLQSLQYASTDTNRT